MRIFEEYIDYGDGILNITDAKYIGDFAIRIRFSDGKERLVDFKPFLQKSKHPSIKKYLNEEVFEKFDIVGGNLNWNEYELIFSIEELYKGEIKV